MGFNQGSCIQFGHVGFVSVGKNHIRSLWITIFLFLIQFLKTQQHGSLFILMFGSAENSYKGFNHFARFIYSYVFLSSFLEP